MYIELSKETGCYPVRVLLPNQAIGEAYELPILINLERVGLMYFTPAAKSRSPGEAKTLDGRSVNPRSPLGESSYDDIEYLEQICFTLAETSGPESTELTLYFEAPTGTAVWNKMRSTVAVMNHHRYPAQPVIARPTQASPF